MSSTKINDPKVAEAMKKIDHFHKFIHSYEEYNKEDQLDSYLASCEVTKYTGPRRAAEVLGGLVNEKENSLVLDLAAGAGAGGFYLSRKGFPNIHAHDGAARMLEGVKPLATILITFALRLAVDKHLMWKTNYDRLVQYPKIEGPSMILTSVNCRRAVTHPDTYSACVASGCVCPGHVPGDCQDEIVRVITPGGYFVNVYREVMVDQQVGQEWAAHASRLESDGQWSFHGRLHFPNFMVGVNGVVDIYRKTKD